MGQRREREERAAVTKQKEEGKGVKCQNGTKEESENTALSVKQGERKTERKRDRE